MLVLSRKAGESIRIGASVTVMVTKLFETRAYLGIQAPKDTLILRSELMAPSWKIPARFPNDPIMEPSICDVIYDMFNGIPRCEQPGYVGHLNRILSAVDPLGTRDGRRCHERKPGTRRSRGAAGAEIPEKGD